MELVIGILVVAFLVWAVFSIVRAPVDRRRRLVGWTLAAAVLGGVLGYTLA